MPSDPGKSRKSKDGSNGKGAKDWRSLGGVGYEFVGAIFLFLLLGWWLDGRWGTSPWLLLTGLAFGFAVGLYRLIAVTTRRREPPE